MLQCTRFLAVFGGMTRLGSFKSQSPSSREVPSPKVQHAAPDGHQTPRALVWSLRFGGSLELGAWSFGARGIPSKTTTNCKLTANLLMAARLRLAHRSKKENPLYTGLIERITSTTFTRRMVGTCEPLSYARVGHLPIFTIAVKLSPSLAPTLDIHDSGPCNK
jgi:hypothetical protein